MPSPIINWAEKYIAEGNTLTPGQVRLARNEQAQFEHDCLEYGCPFCSIEGCCGDCDDDHLSGDHTLPSDDEIASVLLA